MTVPAPHPRDGIVADVGLADVVAAWGQLGGDDARAAAIARCLGYDVLPARPPAPARAAPADGSAPP
ncbi:hypothetical protein AB0K00_48115, partial [Dactylosporangium sp. NPDC049525]|uniref:hypothetical protein n=1 Tax=Dactylosporangium sp. NPDC049525 TaxID=3154730 RepID=UPI0034248ECF